MKDTLVMINDGIPSIDSGREPFPIWHHRRSYLLFSQICREADFPLLFCSPYDYNWEDGTLKGWWEPGDDEWVAYSEPVRPWFIFDKATGADPHCTAVMEQYETAGIPIFNPSGLARLCGDKWRSYLQFARYSPLTALLTQNRETLVDQIYHFFSLMDRTYTEHDNRVVVKPLHGFQARGIHVISRQPHGLEMHMLFGGQVHGMDIQRNLDTMVTTPYLIQAWVNTSGGIPGVGLEMDRHDVRFIFRIKEPGVASFVILYVKTLRGMRYFPLEQFGDEPFKVVNPIADWIASHYSHGIFTVDVMRDVSGNWFLTELNDQPGLTIDFDTQDDVDNMIYFMKVYVEEMKRYLAKIR